jgi:hypothetical protein
MMYGLNGIAEAIKVWAWLTLILGILALWKLADIAIWLFNNVSISFA